jgi:hypothetical protein
MGRPQELINADVDRCELFVGLLWQRWGTPSGTHTSGFHEEFERARARHRSSRAPAIWLHFKDIDAALEADPGREVSQVIAFKTALVQSRELLFKRFATLADWERMFQNNLSEHVVALWARATEASIPAEATASRAVPDAPVATPTSGNAPETTLAAAAAAWRDATASADGAGLLDVSVEHAARMLMSVKTLTSVLYTRDLFGAHDANFVYAHRESSDLLLTEPQFVFQNILGDSGDVIPGWYWLREETPERIHGQSCDAPTWRN